MSGRIQTVTDSGDWQSQLRGAITCPEVLLAELGLEPGAVHLPPDTRGGFPLKVPRAFVRRMRPGDPDDPLLRQVLVAAQELDTPPGYGPDPVGETGAANPRPGIIHKYRGRVLLVASGGCAVHCRYCFRRHFPYAQNRVARDQWAQALDYVAADTTIREVILSGGDPLVLTDPQLEGLVRDIAGIRHVQRLRIHTRLPVVIPDRVTASLLDAVCDPALQTVVVIHANHANEIDTGVHAAMGRLRGAGITTLNQAVLLAGVNDTVGAQVALSEALFAAGVVPYYLHLLDRVQGAAHFEVPENRARILHAELAARLSGYLVPRLVREIAGAEGKVVLSV